MQSQGNTLVKFYKDELADFKIEEELLEELGAFEETVDAVFDPRGPWSWNRNSREVRNGHFSINVKVYQWPDLEEIQKKLPGLADLTEDQLMEGWYDYINENAEMWAADLQERYNWIEEVNFGGRSAGWLNIIPTAGPDQMFENIEHEIQSYLDEKEFIDSLEEVKAKLNSGEWLRLRDLGLSEEDGEAKVIIDKIGEVRNWIKSEMNNVEGMDGDLQEIVRDHKRFTENVEEWFINELKERFEVFEKKKPKGAPNWHDSNAPDAKGRFKTLGIGALADWLIRTRGGNMQRINGSLNQQIVFNRGKNPAYAAKMKKVREAVKRKLAARKK